MLNTGIKKHKEGSTPVPEDFKNMFIQHEDYINDLEKKTNTKITKLTTTVNKLKPTDLTEVNSKINTNKQNINSISKDLVELNKEFNLYKTAFSELDSTVNKFSTKLSDLKSASATNRVLAIIAIAGTVVATIINFA